MIEMNGKEIRNQLLKEYKEILGKYNFKILSQLEAGLDFEVEEDGSTFEENAKIKAEAIYNMTKKSVLSDDSGLEIEALNNEPGVYSARYKGLPTQDERISYILNVMKDETNRKARFVTTICYIDNNGHEELFTGTWDGEIARTREGTNGFGYDSIFISEDGNGKTTASYPIEFKEKYSHRTKAVKLLLDYLNKRE